jgi:hypothetical protein
MNVNAKRPMKKGGRISEMRYRKSILRFTVSPC